jgi:hypothetical protein
MRWGTQSCAGSQQGLVLGGEQETTLGESREFTLGLAGAGQ